MMNYRVGCRLFLVVLLSLLPGALFPMAGKTQGNDVLSSLQFRTVTPSNGMPTNEVQKVYQDREGMVWFATRFGLCRYDGYQIYVFESGLNTPGLLLSNNVYCLSDDDRSNLWIGLQHGLNVLDKKTGRIRSYTTALPNDVISCLLVTRDNTVWIGTEEGLCRYVPESDSFVVYGDGRMGSVFPTASIKSLYEDTDGDLWIGTWSSGLFRYSPKEDRFYTYPRINQRNSAHIIYQDTHGNIWVGSWEYGLFLLEHSKEMDKVTYRNFRHRAGDDTSLSDNIVYALVEDLHTGSLWIGTRSGLSIMDPDRFGTFINYKPQNAPCYIPCDEVNSLMRDREGQIWLASIGGGVLVTDTKRSPFSSYIPDVEGGDVSTLSVRSLFADDTGNLWLGIGSYGLARQDYRTGKLTFYSRLPEFSAVSKVPTVNQIIQRRNGELWIATYDGGILIYRPGEPVQVIDRSPFLYSNCVTALFEDSRRNCWVGCRGGLGVSRADGSSYLFGTLPVEQGDSLNWYYVRDIKEDVDGTMWVATANAGIIRMTGDIARPETLRFKGYNLGNRQLSTNTVNCLYIDCLGRLWAGSEGGGLYSYARGNDRFIPMNRQLDIPSDRVVSIQEDARGSLWLGSNVGLVQLYLPLGGETHDMHIYTTADGLLDNYFIAKASCKRGNELLFAGNKGYNSFLPEELESEDKEVLFQITDIKVFNTSYALLDSTLQRRISPLYPTFAERITLPYNYNNFSIEFASLTYKNPELNRYAFQLEGFDKEWQYTDAGHRFAYYNNLKSGRYTFRLKASNENGIWSSGERTLEVVVLPPYWATWWAYLIYIGLVVSAVYLVYRNLRNRMLLRDKLRLRELEKAQSEELNHAKLQFFTNITHELLTPLTIISAAVEELKMHAPGNERLCTMMSANANRLVHLLQQILEFRKAETGNLKLRVSLGDIAAFVRNEAESFHPLISKRQIHFSVLCNPDVIMGYFDTDKVDKMLYNLLSNAAKYNREGGYIQVTLSYAENHDFVRLGVKDNGQGIPKEKQADLFKRFYEGDYRKFNTIGTGIGLSLVKDLVELHQGTIRVESDEGQGAEFIITLPIDSSYFSEEQIDRERIVPGAKEVAEETAADSGGDEEGDASGLSLHTLLLVEDNEDLLRLMETLLRHDYRVFTAQNGQEAVTIVENEDVDLIVSDIMMPVMDGIALCRYIKTRIEISHIPILLLTAKNQAEDRAEAYEVGADAYLSKPFQLNVLYARIRNLLKARERAAADFKNQLVLEVKDLDYTSLDEDFIKRAIACVNRHLEDCDFDQTRFVEEMGTSKSTLYKKLKSLTGLNTSAFIRNIRLKAACTIMEEKGSMVRISDLAYAVGFNDPKYFSSCFKKEFGILPTDYLERFTTK